MNVSSFFTRIQKKARKIWDGATTPEMSSCQSLSERAFLALFALDEVSHLLEQNKVKAARAALLAHYDRRREPAWPSFPEHIIYNQKNVQSLSQEELLATADALIENRFMLSKVRPPMPAGRIDWHYKTRKDPRWAKRLHRFTWLPVLTLAYTQSGDERYARKFVSSILDWIERNPPPSQRDESDPAWNLMGIGMRLVSWTAAFAQFYQSPAFTDEAKLKMLRAIYDQARFLSLFRTDRNHLLRESNGLAYVAVYFPEFREAESWRQEAFTRLDQALSDQVNRDGSHIEVSTGYQWLVVEEFEGAYDLLQANNLALPNEDLSGWLEKMYQVLAYVIRPDGSYPQINDGPIEDKEMLLARLVRVGEDLGRGDFIYIGSGGRQGGQPSVSSMAFPDGGFYVMRSDWTKDARYLFFDAGPYGGFHGHEDKLSIELYAYGRSFIVDSGSYTYHSQDPYRLYFIGSYGHNTVLVDGLSQIRRWDEANMNPGLTSDNQVTWTSQAGFDYVAATYDDGYGEFSLKQPEGDSITSDVSHTRRILFVKPDYWIIVDELQAAEPHNYQLLFHTGPGLTMKQQAVEKVVLTAESGQASLCLIPADPHNLKLDCLAGSENPIQGWYSRTFYYKIPTPTLIYERENSASTVLATLLYPSANGRDGQQISFESLSVSGNRGAAYKVTTERGSDYFLFAHDDGPKQFGPYQAEGIVAGVRTDPAGAILSRFDWQPENQS